VDKKPLIVVSICAVVLLVLGSLSNVVGYQTVQSSNQSVIKERINQRELLFQTIVDIANNKEIQRLILKSQISRDGFFNPDVRFSTLNTPMLTKNQLKQMYVIGLVLSKISSKSRMHSMLGQYQLGNQEMQKEISAVIKKDAKLSGEISQLSKLNTLLNTSIFQILILIILSITLFIACIVSGFFTFVSVSIAAITVFIEKYTGVWILGPIMTLTIGFSMIIWVNVFLISIFAIFVLLGGQVPYQLTD